MWKSISRVALAVALSAVAVPATFAQDYPIRGRTMTFVLPFGPIGSADAITAYCDRYRPVARQAQSIDTNSCHIGFHCTRPASLDDLT